MSYYFAPFLGAIKTHEQINYNNETEGSCLLNKKQQALPQFTAQIASILLLAVRPCEHKLGLLSLWICRQAKKLTRVFNRESLSG